MAELSQAEQALAETYASHLRRAEKLAAETLDEAMAQAKEAIAVDPLRPEAFDLLGEYLDKRGQHENAQKLYRVALALDPSYKRAKRDLYRSVGIKEK